MGLERPFQGLRESFPGFWWRESAFGSIRGSSVRGCPVSCRHPSPSPRLKTMLHARLSAVPDHVTKFLISYQKVKGQCKVRLSRCSPLQHFWLVKRRSWYFVCPVSEKHRRTHCSSVSDKHAGHRFVLICTAGGPTASPPCGSVGCTVA